ncbi:uncharacterized protein V6R79_007529 [Siganus canaliculatus]
MIILIVLSCLTITVSAVPARMNVRPSLLPHREAPENINQIPDTQTPAPLSPTAEQPQPDVQPQPIPQGGLFLQPPMQYYMWPPLGGGPMVIPLQPSLFGSQPHPLTFPPDGYFLVLSPYRNQLVSPYGFPAIFGSPPSQAPANQPPNTIVLPPETPSGAAPSGNTQQSIQQQQSPQIVYMLEQTLNAALGSPSSEELEMAARMGQLGVYLSTVITNPSLGGAILPVNQAAGLENPDQGPTVGTTLAKVPQTREPAGSGLQSNTKKDPAGLEKPTQEAATVQTPAEPQIPTRTRKPCPKILSSPQPEMYMEFDIRHAPAEAASVIPAGVPLHTLEVLLPVDGHGRPIAGAVRGLIKQEIRSANGKESTDVYYSFGFDVPAPAPAAPAAPAAPVVPVVPAAPAAPAAPVAPAIAAPVSWCPIKDVSDFDWHHRSSLITHHSSLIVLSSGVFATEGLRKFVKMKLVILCLCLASTVSAAPSFYHYLPHYAATRSQVQPSQVKTPFPAPQVLPQPGLPGAYSVELIYPHRFLGAGGSNPAQPFPSHGFIKYSIPQPPGRQSVEVYYPYDFSQQRILTNMPPMANVPHMPNVLPFDFPPQNTPQIPNIPSFDANPLPSQDPLPPLQQDQPTQTSQTAPKV